MKKIFNNIKKGLVKSTQFLLGLQSKFTLANDKLGHFYWGFIYAYPLDVLFGNPYLTIGIPLALAITKELKDKQVDENGNKLGNFEFLDIVATIAPGILLAIY